MGVIKEKDGVVLVASWPLPSGLASSHWSEQLVAGMASLDKSFSMSPLEPLYNLVCTLATCTKGE